jgi:hypothetical protein
LKTRFFLILWLACLAVAAPWATTLTAAKYPPGSHWREIGRGPFTVIFPASRRQQADAALASAERAYKKLAAFWRGQPAGRIRIVLDDSTDQANGFATFYPFNLVGVNLAEPPPDSELAASRGWLDLVLTHELTHIFTLNAVAEPFLKLRRVFGSQPILYPAVQLPPWVIEGLGVYGESEFTGDGRLNHPPFALMLAAARRDGMFPGWSRIAGMPVAWPGPAGKYLFGAGFMEFLAEKYGADSLRRYLHRVSSRLLLISSNRDFSKTFGEPLGKLWAAYRDDKPTAGGPAPEPLTDDGFLQQYPCLLGEDRLLYYRRNYQSRGEVAVLNLKTGQDQALFKMDVVNGLSVAENGKKILLSAVDNFHLFSEFSDLYEYDLEKGKLKRLSRGQRLSHPVRSVDGAWLYCVQRRNNRSRLAMYSMKKREARSISMSFAGLAQLSLSPDGTRIAAAAKPAGGPWGIAVFLENGSLVRFLSVAGSGLSQPRWQGNDALLFIVSGKKTSHLASYSLDTDGGWRLEDPQMSGLRQFDLSLDGKELFFTYYSGRGEEIARRPLSATPLSPMEITVASGIPDSVADSPPTVPFRSRPYRFWRDLLPRWWSPALRGAGAEVQAGIVTGGQDALGVHSYSLEGYYGFSSHRGNTQFRYAYEGLFPTLSLSVADNSDFYRTNAPFARGFSERSQKLKLASLWPLRVRQRSQLYAYADLHLERRTDIYQATSYRYRGSFNGCTLGLDFNTARMYFDSISPSDGGHATLQYFHQPAGWNDGRSSRSASADLRYYIPLFRPGVLACRLALARIWDDPYGAFPMGGGEGDAGGGLGENRPFGLLRGFPAGYLWGDRGYLLNLEYRLPLFRIEKAVLPSVGLNRAYLNAFLDLGRLWFAGWSSDPALALGAEVALRLAVGGAAFADVALGVARGIRHESATRVYLRFGRSF